MTSSRTSTAPIESGTRPDPKIAEHLAYLNDLSQRFPWVNDPEGPAELRRLIGRVRERLDDPNLYVAVIGEFTSGKSSLINGVIGSDLLVTDILPATTAAATFLRSGAEFCLRVEWLDDNREVYESKPSTLEQLSRELSSFTTDEEIASQVREVHVELPQECLNEQLTLIDTPGTDVDNPRHIQIAGWATQERSDLVLVSLPATAPLGHRFETFLRKHLGDALHRTLFAVTKIDLIPEDERPRLLRQVTARLQARLDLQAPRVMAVSPLAVRTPQTLEDRLSASEIASLNRDFQTFRQCLMDGIRHQRRRILVERALELTTRASNHLQAGLEDHIQKGDAEHRALEAHRIRDLEGFLAEHRGRSYSRCAPPTAEIVQSATDSVVNLRRKVERAIKKAIDSSRTAAALRSEVARGLEQELRQSRKGLKKSVKKALSEIGAVAQETLEAFEREFSSAYRDLATLGGVVQTQSKWDRKARSLTANLSTRSDRLTVDLASLALTSTTFGEDFAEVLEDLIDPEVGEAFRRFFGLETLDDRKRRLWKSLRRDLKGRFEDLEGGLLQALEKERQHLLRKLYKAINCYGEQYGLLVTEMIEKDEKKMARLEERRREIQSIVGDLRRRSGTLEALKPPWNLQTAEAPPDSVGEAKNQQE